MSPLDLTLFAGGWIVGWLLLWRPRPLPRGVSGARRDPIAVVIPARNEGGQIGDVVDLVIAQLAAGDELLVVDDHSDDDTANIARERGAEVVTTSPPPGWLGKPHACWQGTLATTAPTLLFLDADVRPAPDLLDRIGAAVADHPDVVVSVQPWHRTERWYEQASMLFNVTALMGCGAFTALRSNSSTVAFGPVLAIRRDTYDRIGGHAAVRTMHTEDIGVARHAGGALLHTGRPDTSFRMYPDGAGQLVNGWTRSIATGLRSTRWWWSLATVWWVAALAGGWLAAGWPSDAPVAFASVYAACALQLWVLGRRAGSIRVATALLYPAAVVVFVAIVVRSVVVLAVGRPVTWKGRRVDSRSG